MSSSLVCKEQTTPFTSGLDNRTERTRERVNYDTSYQKIFARVNQELINGKAKHLIVMLGIVPSFNTNSGIPIAYPRLVWLETILTSRIMTPIKLLARMGLFGGLINNFDRGIEILDDLDDHWYSPYQIKGINQ